MGCGYRNLVGELIYAMVTCHLDISFATVKCAQASACPAEIHFKAVKHCMRYLYATCKDGIYFWRAEPRMDLPNHPLPQPVSSDTDLLPAGRRAHGALESHGHSDSDWATCSLTRRSFTGICVRLEGGTIGYKTKLQLTVAGSSTEAEFMAAYYLAKMLLYVRSILYDLDIPQEAAAVIYEDNDGCTAMANAGKPTTRTRHMDIKYFALSEWTEQDLIILERVSTAQNMADHFTKCLSRILFYLHNDYIMGRVIPPHSPLFTPGYTPMAPAAAAAKVITLGNRSIPIWDRIVSANDLFV
jgi:hypothetical protein